MSDESAEPGQLRAELQVVEKEFDARWRTQMGRWGFHLGPFKMAHYVSAMFIVQVYVVFNVACFFSGVGLAFIGGVFTTIGIAVMVGALFSFGAFVAQFWAVRVQQNIDLNRKIYQDEADFVELKELAKKWNELHRRIHDLKQ
jgi:hypothetical protein